MIIQRVTQNRLVLWAKGVAHSSREHPALSLLVTALVVVAISSFVLPRRFVVLNGSPSVARGLYVAIDAPPERGQLVEFRLPCAFQNIFVERLDCATPDGLILKRIAAASGDCVDTIGTWLRINGVPIAPIQTLDSKGRPLPVWRANRLLRADEFFVFSDRVWNSFDSRYFGPIRHRDIIAVRAPLITWGRR